MSASPSAQETFDQIERELGAGLVPRIFRLLEPNPALLFHIWGQFRTVVLEGNLPRILKEMVGTAIATSTHCEYVRAVHLHSLNLQGVTPEALDAVRNGDFGSDALSATTRDVLRFAALAAAARAATASADAGEWQGARSRSAEAFAALPLDDGERFELLATVALFEEVCAVANMLDLDPSQP